MPLGADTADQIAENPKSKPKSKITIKAEPLPSPPLSNSKADNSADDEHHGNIQARGNKKQDSLDPEYKIKEFNLDTWNRITREWSKLLIDNGFDNPRTMQKVLDRASGRRRQPAEPARAPVVAARQRRVLAHDSD